MGWGQSSAVRCRDGFDKMTKQCRCRMVRAGLLWKASPCPLQAPQSGQAGPWGVGLPTAEGFGEASRAKKELGSLNGALQKKTVCVK